MINNTACFGIDARALCSTLKQSLATGATVNEEVPQCEGPQILVNGNQVCTSIHSFVANMHIKGQYRRRAAAKRVQDTKAVH